MAWRLFATASSIEQQTAWVSVLSPRACDQSEGLLPIQPYYQSRRDIRLLNVDDVLLQDPLPYLAASTASFAS